MGVFLSIKRMKFLVVAFLIGAASSFKISSKEDLIKRFGEKNVSFDPNVRTNYCNQYITPDPNSNPIIYYLRWEVADNVGSLNSGIMNDAYTSGINCPYEIPDQWEYSYQLQWFVDPTLKFN